MSSSSMRETLPAPDDAAGSRSVSPAATRLHPGPDHDREHDDSTGAEASARPSPTANAATAAEQHPFLNAHGTAYEPASAYVLAGTGAGAGPGAAATGDQAVSPTFMQKMAAADEHWLWKLSLRALLLLADIIAIACIGAVLSKGSGSNLFSDEDYFDYSYILPYALIPLGVSFVWCAVVILVLFLRRPPRAVHPGVAVGMDLVLWLAFIISILITAVCVSDLASFGSDSFNLDDPSGYHSGYSGHYTLASNDSWVYVITYTRDYYNYNKLAVPATATATATPTGITVATTTTPLPSSSGAAVTVTARYGPTGTPLRQHRRAVVTSSATSSASGLGDEDDPYYPYYYSYASYDPESTASASAGDGDDGDDDPYYYYSYSYFDPYDTSSTKKTASSSTPTPTPVTRDCTPEFTSCAEQDAYINRLWHARGHRFGQSLAAIVTEGIALVLHFVLFVWACVDTARRNRKRGADAVTLDVLESMRSRGYVMVRADQAFQANRASQHMGGGYPGGLQSPYEQPSAAGEDVLESPSEKGKGVAPEVRFA